jgi:alpha-1,3-fucosyltransferase 10
VVGNHSVPILLFLYVFSFQNLLLCLQDYLPSKKSAVLVNDFDDVKDLAELIQYLDKNDTAYEEYLHFKERNGITNTFLTNELNNREWSKYDDLKRPYWSFFSGFECYICERIHENIDAINSGKRIHTKIAKLEHYGCPPPKRFNNSSYAVSFLSRYWISSARSLTSSKSFTRTADFLLGK